LAHVHVYIIFVNDRSLEVKHVIYYLFVISFSDELLEATDHLLRLQSLVMFDKVAYDCTAVFQTSPFLAVSPPMGLLKMQDQKCRTTGFYKCSPYCVDLLCDQPLSTGLHFYIVFQKGCQTAGGNYVKFYSTNFQNSFTDDS